MRCVYCDKELKSSADDYKNCICSECKKPKYPFQQGIIEQQNKIADLEQENKQLKEQLDIKDKALELACNELDYLKSDIFKTKEWGEKLDSYKHFIEQAKESMK